VKSIRGAVVLAAASAGVAWIGGPGARGAHATEVRLTAPDGCAEADQVIADVELLLHRPLASIEGVDFDVVIAEGARKRWQLRVVTTDRASGERRSRDIPGLDCAELARAAAVAIAMSIEESSAGDPTTTGPRQETVPVRLAQPPAIAALAPAPVVTGRTWQLSVGIGAVGDTGTLPHFAFGAEVDVGWRIGVLRLLGVGTLLPAQESRFATGAGGTFRLIAGGPMFCMGRGERTIGVFACAGGELGQLSGEGLGVTRPQRESALWAAGRAEVGGAVTIAPRWRAWLRAALVIPASRPTFVLDQVTPVYQPGGAIARASLGVDFDF
jgi:hypothetical protein